MPFASDALRPLFGLTVVAESLYDVCTDASHVRIISYGPSNVPAVGQCT